MPAGYDRELLSSMELPRTGKSGDRDHNAPSVESPIDPGSATVEWVNNREMLYRIERYRINESNDNFRRYSHSPRSPRALTEVAFSSSFTRGPSCDSRH
jgi:hypothetical protein